MRLLIGLRLIVERRQPGLQINQVVAQALFPVVKDRKVNNVFGSVHVFLHS
ncbi:MAG: hypothetical protein M3R61_18110 [Chloroflexota bacterium]|nr:hypothetical protein [Chloroflexota bacterium]